MPESTCQGAKIFMVCEYPVVRQGLSLVLRREGLVVCGEAENKEQALRSLAIACPDVVLVDSEGACCLDLIAELGARNVKSLVYSTPDDACHIEAAIAAGALGYVTKRELVAILLNAIQELLSNRRYLSPVTTQILATKMLSDKKTIQLDSLSERELRIFYRMGEGDSAPEIAETLGISPRTVESYYARLMKKLGIAGVKKMRRLAIQHVRNLDRTATP